MSAPPCRQCGGPVEDLRHGYATPVCFACLKPSWQEAELTRLRAALAEIAALQTEEPRFDAHIAAGGTSETFGYANGKWVAAEMARKALVSK